MKEGEEKQKDPETHIKEPNDLVVIQSPGTWHEGKCNSQVSSGSNRTHVFENSDSDKEEPTIL